MSEDKEFVTYVQSLALKELGFDEPCFAYYGLNNVEDKIFFDIDPDDGELTSLNQNQFYHNNLSEVGRISAPLKQQVFRWFREKHGMQGCIEFVEPEYGGDYGYKLYYKPGHLYIDHWNKGFKSYEEAESSCIDKLIELIKEKKS